MFWKHIRDENNNWPFSDQISNIATHFLICLTYSDQTKGYVYIGGSLGLTPFKVIVTNTQ